LKGIGAAEIVGFVERADLAGDVAFEHAATEHKAKKREEESGLERHQEMAGCHGERAEKHSAAPAEDAIGKEAAKDRGEINGGGVSAEDRGGERLTIEPAVQGKLAKRGEDRHPLDTSWEEKILHHVKDK